MGSDETSTTADIKKKKEDRERGKEKEEEREVSGHAFEERASEIQADNDGIRATDKTSNASRTHVVDS